MFENNPYALSEKLQSLLVSFQPHQRCFFLPTYYCRRGKGSGESWSEVLPKSATGTGIFPWGPETGPSADTSSCLSDNRASTALLHSSSGGASSSLAALCGSLGFWAGFSRGCCLSLDIGGRLKAATARPNTESWFMPLGPNRILSGLIYGYWVYSLLHWTVKRWFRQLE